MIHCGEQYNCDPEKCMLNGGDCTCVFALIQNEGMSITNVPEVFNQDIAQDVGGFVCGQDMLEAMAAVARSVAGAVDPVRIMVSPDYLSGIVEEAIRQFCFYSILLYLSKAGRLAAPLRYATDNGIFPEAERFLEILDKSRDHQLTVDDFGVAWCEQEDKDCGDCGVENCWMEYMRSLVDEAEDWENKPDTSKPPGGKMHDAAQLGFVMSRTITRILLMRSFGLHSKPVENTMAMFLAWIFYRNALDHAAASCKEEEG